MIESLTIANLNSGSIPLSHSGEIFTLKTCQRTIIVGFGHTPFKFIENIDQIKNIYNGLEAYQFLLETILGLHSAVIAEYEVVNQFKDAYQLYLEQENRNGHLITLLEKIFKDHKKIRSEHLMELGQLSYAGITRKLINHHTKTDSVLILGSGQLSIDLINLLKKKYNITISARNSEKVNLLVKDHGIKSIPWMDHKNYSQFSHIVNTIGANEIIFDEYFFAVWHSQNFLTPTRLFIDLGSPSVIQTSLTKSHGVIRLENIFEESVKLSREKMEKIESAKKAVINLTKERHERFSITIPFGWEELQFA
jgi:glutamyl-tRNA reductase